MNDVKTNEKILAFQLNVPVRWADMDVNGHVNNVRFFTYFECARLAWLQAIRARGERNGQGSVVASASCNYKRPIPYPETVLINLYVSSPGRSSYTTHYDLLSAADHTIKYGDGTAVMVWVDRNTGKSQQLPDYMRAVFESANAVTV